MTEGTQAQDATDQAQDATGITDATKEPVLGGGSGNEEKDEALERAHKERQKANREAQEAKKRADAAEAKLKAIEDEKKSSEQRAQERAEQAEKQLEAERQARSKQERINIALKHGSVDSDYVAWKLEQDKPANPEEYMHGLKKTSPHLFAIQKPAQSAEGGPGMPKSEKETELAALDKKIEEAAKARNSTLVFALQHQKNRLLEKT